MNNKKNGMIIKTLEKSIHDYAVKCEKASEEKDLEAVYLYNCLGSEASIMLKKLKLSN